MTPKHPTRAWQGEIYDARLEDEAWDKPGFKPSSSEWGKAVAYSGASAQFGPLSLAQYPSVAITESHAPVRQRKAWPSNQLLSPFNGDDAW